MALGSPLSSLKYHHPPSQLYLRGLFGGEYGNADVSQCKSTVLKENLSILEPSALAMNVKCAETLRVYAHLCLLSCFGRQCEQMCKV